VPSSSRRCTSRAPRRATLPHFLACAGRGSWSKRSSPWRPPGVRPPLDVPGRPGARAPRPSRGSVRRVSVRPLGGRLPGAPPSRERDGVRRSPPDPPVRAPLGRLGREGAEPVRPPVRELDGPLGRLGRADVRPGRLAGPRAAPPPNVSSSSSANRRGGRRGRPPVAPEPPLDPAPAPALRPVLVLPGLRLPCDPEVDLDVPLEGLPFPAPGGRRPAAGRAPGRAEEARRSGREESAGIGRV
jgi:hypothetical protein